jgi:oligopeptide transport system permease protein
MDSRREITGKVIFEKAEAGTSLWRDAWRRLRKNRLAMTGLVLLALIFVFALAGPWFVPHRFDEQHRANKFQAPSAEHLFGTDLLGRDLLVRVMVGGRISLSIGLAATAVSIFIGVTYGAIAGYAGGRVDSAMMRIVDILYALPYTIFVIILMTVFGRNFILLFAAIGAVEWLTMSRIVRGQVMSLAKREFIEAAAVMGLPRTRVLFRHLIPNVLGPVIIYTTLTVPRVMLFEAFLSFLGLGVQAPMSSWGTLIKEGTAVMEEHPWVLIFPSVAFSVTLFSLNTLGDGLRDALDPRSSKD